MCIAHESKNLFLLTSLKSVQGHNGNHNGGNQRGNTDDWSSNLRGIFSATFCPQVQELAAEFRKNSFRVQQTIHQVTEQEKRKKLIKILTESDSDGTIVFVERKRLADFLASYLSDQRNKTLTSTSIHGDRTKQQREEALKEFRYGKRKVPIATSGVARCLGKQDS